MRQIGAPEAGARAVGVNKDGALQVGFIKDAFNKRRRPHIDSG